MCRGLKLATCTTMDPLTVLLVVAGNNRRVGSGLKSRPLIAVPPSLMTSQAAEAQPVPVHVMSSTATTSVSRTILVDTSKET